MAATVVTKILRGFLKNLPRGEAKELAGRYGYLKSEPKAAREISDAEVKARKEIAERIRKTGVRREPKKEKQFELLVEEPKEEIITTIDTKAWEKAGFPGLREHATERLSTAQQRQKRLQSTLEERLDIVDVGKETAKEKVARVKEIQRLREVGVAQERLNRFAGREFWKGEKGELLPITDEQMIESGYERMGTRIPSDEPRDPFGHLLSEFREWGKEHMQMKAMLRDKEQTFLKEGKIERILSEAEIDQAVTNEVNKGRPLYESYSQYIPYKDAPSGQYVMTKVDVPPTAQDVRRLSRGEEVPSEIIVAPESEKVIGEEIATSYGMPVEEIPSFQPVLSVNPAQEKVLFRQEISGLPQRQVQAGKREQFLETLNTFGRRAEPTAIRGQQELSLGVPSISDPKIIARLRKEASDIRRRGGKFRIETAGLNPQQREQAWDKLRSRPEFMKYIQDRTALKREIAAKAPNLMEFDEYVRPQRRISRPKSTVRDIPEEQMELEYKERDLSTLLPSELDKAFAAGEININNPQLIARWKADAPRRKATDEALERFSKKLNSAKKIRNTAISKNRIAKLENKFAEEMDAIDAGFVTKDKKANVAAWKKAGSPEPLDWKDIDTDKVVRPKQKLVDSFKKGSKVVSRKRGGMIKKPRGWGAARYNIN